MSAAAAPPAFTPQQLHLSILQYLTHLQQSGGESAKAAGIVDLEPLEVAIQCLTEATGVSYQPNQILSNDAGLSELYQIGSRTLSSLESHPKYSSFLATLKSSDFFKGIQEGSFEYVQRLEQARQKFQEKFLNGGEQTTEAAPAPAASASAAPVEVTAEMKSAAESAKNEGNALLGKGDHAGAVAKYSDAIKLNPNHAIYFANRAAAYVNLREYKKAIADCESSIFLDPAYPKSHYRLGQSLAALGEHANAIDAFEAALSRSGRDEGMAVTIREQIKISKAKLNPTPAHAGGADPFAALGGMGGLGGLDFGSLLNNPALAGLMNSPEIANMMKSPDMMNMMKNLDFGSMMKDPAMAGLMGQGGLEGAARNAAGSAGKIQEVDTSYKPPSASDLFDDAPPAAAAAAPAAAPKPAAPASSSPAGGIPSQIQSFLNTPAGQAAAADPDLQPVLADIKANGIGAAMKYMSNPTVMSKIQAIMGPMMAGGRK